MKNYLLFTIILLVAYTNAFSQRTLSYQEAIQIALKENIEARTQENQLVVIQAEKKQGYAAFLPTGNLVVNTERAAGNQFIPEFDQRINTVSESFWGQAGVDIDLFTGFSRLNTLKRNQYRIESQKNLIKRTKQVVAFNVTSQYLQVLLDEELLKVAENNLKTQKEVLKNLQELVESGLRGAPEEYIQETEVSRMETMVIQRRNTLINDKATLAQTLQIDPTEEFDLEAPNVSADQVRNKVFQLEELYQAATTVRPDLIQSEFDVKAAKHSISIAKASYLPSVNAYYRYRSFWNSANNLRNFGEQFGEDNIRKTLGATLVIPVFGGLRNRTQFINSKILYENARLTRQNLEKTVRIDVRNAYQNFLAAKQNLEASETQFEVAERSYKAQKDLFDNELNDVMNLTRSNNGLVVAKANLAQAKYTMMFQEIMLKHATGVLNPDDMLAE